MSALTPRCRSCGSFHVWFIRAAKIMDAVYVSLYDLTSPHEKVLSFRKGDRFIPLSSKSNNPNWAQVVDLGGNIGFVPFSYVTSESISKPDLSSMIEIVLDCFDQKFSGVYNKQQRRAIQELTTWRTLLLSPMHSPIDAPNRNMCDVQSISNEKLCEPPEITACAAPDILAHSSGVNNVHFESSPEHFNISSNAQKPSCQKIIEKKDFSIQCIRETSPKMNHVSTSTESLPTSHISSPVVHTDVPIWLVPRLIENVRQKTNLSHINSKVAVTSILDILSDALPNMAGVWDQLKDNVNIFNDENHLEVIQEKENVEVFSEDKRKLLDIFKQLWYCKNDEQQRSWPLHEDEEKISSLLKDLRNILVDADPRITKQIVQHEDYEMVNLLVTYYQMETRRNLRVKILKVFSALCELDLVVVSILLNSLLPMELARDMQCSFDDSEKVLDSCFVLTIIFSTGQKPPLAIYDFFNNEFFHFLYENMEESLKIGNEQVGDHLLNVLLAFNLHMVDYSSNIIFGTLKERNDACMLTEKLMFLLNREDDPVRILSCPVETPNSVLKFMVDFFSYSELVSLFYFNDIKVLLDIIVRQLIDDFSGEKNRVLYLHLVKNILANSDYDEHFHQRESLQECFQTILAQETSSQAVILRVKDILEQFSTWFA